LRVASEARQRRHQFAARRRLQVPSKALAIALIGFVKRLDARVEPLGRQIGASAERPSERRARVQLSEARSCRYAVNRSIDIGRPKK